VVKVIVISITKGIEMAKSPFSGSIEFKLVIRAFGVSVIRQAMALYTYTPAWSYFHVLSGQERTDHSHLDFGLSLLAVPRSDRKRTAPSPIQDPYWVPVGQLLAVGVLRMSIYDQLHLQIDTEAQRLDRANRISAGLPVPPLPEQI
jgi:hypothetical protein